MPFDQQVDDIILIFWFYMLTHEFEERFQEQILRWSLPQPHPEFACFSPSF